MILFIDISILLFIIGFIVSRTIYHNYRIEYLKFRYIAYPQEREQLMALTNELLRQPGFLEIFNYFPYDVTTPGFGQFIKLIIEEFGEV